jgi:hypothetical protein
VQINYPAIGWVKKATLLTNCSPRLPSP